MNVERTQTLGGIKGEVRGQGGSRRGACEKFVEEKEWGKKRKEGRLKGDEH